MLIVSDEITVAELRGWKEICEFLNVKHKKTARRILDGLKLLAYDVRTPVLNKSAYMKVSYGRHLVEQN